LECPRAGTKRRPEAACKAFFGDFSAKKRALANWSEKIARFSISQGALVDRTPNQQPDMKSKKNLTRFTYESAAFEGWRLCISRAGTTFTRYFPDKKFGGGKKSLAAAEKTLGELKEILDGSKRVDGKLSATTIRKAEKLLADAV
jgi:hypothetical protein